MPIKNGKVATRVQIMEAIKEHQPFAAGPLAPSEADLEIVTPQPYPSPRDDYGREHRAFIRDIRTKKVLISATSAYALLEQIESGWKWEPNKKEGLFS